MKMTKILGLTLMFALLVVPAAVNGRSLQECLNDFVSAALTIREVNEICGLLKTFLKCVASGQSLNYELREQLKKSLQSEFDKYNLNCGYSVDELIDEAFNGAKTSSDPLSFLTLILVAFGGFTLVRNLA